MEYPKKIIVTSYPRCGSTLLRCYLMELLKNDGYAATHCNNYEACNQVPCQCENPATVTKDHDFSLNRVVDNNHLYIIMLRRNKIANLESYTRYFLKKYDLEHTPKNCIKHIRTFNRYYNKFYHKYVPERSNCLVIFSEDFETKPEEHVRKIVAFLNLKTSNETIMKIINDNPMRFTQIDPERMENFEKIYRKYILKKSIKGSINFNPINTNQIIKCEKRCDQTFEKIKEYQ